jgi:hypothetical protein
MSDNNETREPEFATQLDAYSKLEKVDITKYRIKIMCDEPGCMQIRYINPQDRHQVKKCKPHSRVARLNSRASRARDRRKTKNK